jgi:deazaflavin-dependent oxidoreductase (nitroreductase family)
MMLDCPLTLRGRGDPPREVAFSSRGGLQQPQLLKYGTPLVTVQSDRDVIAEFRANAGSVAAFAGRRLLLLHTTGARSGKRRVTPLAYRRVGAGYAVFASNAGAPTNPHWYHNLLADPRVTVEFGSLAFEVIGRVADSEERGRIWNRQIQEFPHFAEYEQKTTRIIPVVILEPAPTSHSTRR